MDERGYYYPDVPDILKALQAEGLPPSAKRVRARRGDAGSLTSIQEDIRRWQHAQGIVEEDQEATTPRLVLAMPDTLPAPNPELVAVALATARGRANRTIAESHLRAAIGALRCVDEAVAKVVPFMNAAHARRETPSAGAHGLNRSHPPYFPALDVLHRHSAEVRAAYETILQAVTLVIAEGTNHGNGRPAA